MSKIHIILIILLLTTITTSLYGIIINNNNDSIKAIELRTEGQLLFDENLYSEALVKFLQSLELRKKKYLETSVTLAPIYLNITTTYRNLGIFDLALKHNKLAEIAYSQKYDKSNSRFATVYLNYGNIYREQLDYNQALLYFNRSIEILENQNNKNITRISIAYYSLAEIHYLLNDFQKSLDIITKNISDADTSTQILYFNLQGNIYQEQEQFEKASESYIKAINISRIFNKDYPLQIAEDYLSYSSFLNRNEKIVEATSNLNHAYSIISEYEKDKSELLAEYYQILGNIIKNKHVSTVNLFSFKQERSRNLQEAIINFNKSLVALNFPTDITDVKDLESIYCISDIQALGILQQIAETYMENASIYEGNDSELELKLIEKALDFYNFSATYVQHLRREISDDESKIILAGLQQSTFIEVVKASNKAYKLNRNSKYLELAFKNAERSKASAVFDKLSNQFASENSLIPDSFIEKEQTINISLAAKRAEQFELSMEEDPDTSLIEKNDSIILELTNEHNALNDFLEANYADYYTLKYSNTLSSISDIQLNLKNEEVLFEYILNENGDDPELYTMLIAKNKVLFEKQEVDTIFLNNIENTFRFMSNKRYMFTKNKESKKFCIAAHQLYKVLIEPFKNEIESKKIIIVPDGKLSYIAFDALLENLPDTSKTIQFNKLDYLIKKNSFSYAYSANLLFNFADVKRKTRGKVLAFAPIYESDTLKIKNQQILLPPLPGTQKEVKAISETLKTVLFTGNDASEVNFRNNSERFDIIHLAMHAIINDSLPAFSQLAFSQIKNDTTRAENDGRLNTIDIYNLKLNARLVVLSACNTGQGIIRKGEGVMSLARGFFYAGCPSIVMTLWEVEDNSGTKIMNSFYRNLKKGKTKSDALQLAKLEYIENAHPRFSHPHYWLGYVNIGDNSPLYKSYDIYFFSLLILSIIGIFVDQLYRIKKARKIRT